MSQTTDDRRATDDGFDEFSVRSDPSHHAHLTHHTTASVHLISGSSRHNAVTTSVAPSTNFTINNAANYQNMGFGVPQILVLSTASANEIDNNINAQSNYCVPSTSSGETISYNVVANNGNIYLNSYKPTADGSCSTSDENNFNQSCSITTINDTDVNVVNDNAPSFVCAEVPAITENIPVQFTDKKFLPANTTQQFVHVENMPSGVASGLSTSSIATHFTKNKLVAVSNATIIHNGLTFEGLADEYNNKDGINYIILPSVQGHPDGVMPVDLVESILTVPTNTVVEGEPPRKRKKRMTAKGLGYLNVANIEVNGAAATSETKSKRNALSLRTKVDIIKRISSGEKLCDVADEYEINRFSVKTIMNKAQTYIQYWNKGVVNPGMQRLKGAKMEDLESVLSYWCTKVSENKSLNMSGTILCAKALEIAEKLGYTDFKASHGWLDRFKKRNGVVFNRPSSKKMIQSEQPPDQENSQSSYRSLEEMLLYYDPSNVFCILETGLFYKSLPSTPDCLISDRCSGGARPKDRFSILMCTNMTASEKFPLLVVGSIPKTNFNVLVKDPTIQYTHDQDSWLTRDCIHAWLCDLDDWFLRHRRKVLMISSNISIYDVRKYPQYNAITLHQLPSTSATLQTAIVTSFKLNYRQSLLTEYISSQRSEEAISLPTENTKLKFAFTTCVNLLGRAWQAITEHEIMATFQQLGISKLNDWNMNHKDGFANFRPEIFETFREYEEFLATMSMSDYVHFDDNVQVCEELNVEDMIARVLGIRLTGRADNSASEETEDCDVEKSLKTIRAYVDVLANPELSDAMKEVTDLLDSIKFVE